jgi:hypothetical protein
MTLALRALLALAGLLLLGAGLGLALLPAQLAHDFAVASTGVAGLGTLRANLGGRFVALAAFLFAGLRPGRAHWLLVPLGFIGLILVLRLVHLVLDGTSGAGLRSTGVEIVLVALLAAGRRALGRPTAG